MSYKNLLNWVNSTSIYKTARDKKAKSRADALNGLLSDDSKIILDFGCGNMNLDKLLSQIYPNLQIIGLDTIKHHDIDISGFPNLTFQLHEGLEIPFPDNYFDCSLAAAALHHTNSPEKYLKEMVRVTRKGNNIIVLEATYTSILGWLALQVNDRIRNYILKPELKGPLSFLSEDEWSQLFEDLSLRVVEERKVRPYSVFLTQTLYCLSSH